MKLKVEDHDNLVKDTYTNAVINTDSVALDRARRRKEAAARKTNEVQQLKQDVAEIKSLLQQLLDR